MMLECIFIFIYIQKIHYRTPFKKRQHEAWKTSKYKTFFALDKGYEKWHGNTQERSVLGF